MSQGRIAALRQYIIRPDIVACPVPRAVLRVTIGRDAELNKSIANQLEDEIFQSVADTLKHRRELG